MTYDLMRLAATPVEVAALTRSQRETRVTELVAEAHYLLDQGIQHHILDDGLSVAAVVILFSGGNDSTTLAHIFKDRATHAAHANTTIGIEQTRQYVRDVCAEWGLPLIERTPPRISDQYRALVLDQGFPGPGHHFKMFQRLKERSLRQVRRELVSNPRQDRVVFLAGRRRTESKRRANVPEFERVGSTVWISPLINWTKLDMNTYRLMQGDVPVSEVAALIHMSGECLCGAFASPGERAELDLWFPADMEQIRELEELIADRTDIPDYRKQWGWGADPDLLAKSRKRDRTPSKAGPLCDACDDKLFELEEIA